MELADCLYTCTQNRKGLLGETIRPLALYMASEHPNNKIGHTDVYQ